MIKNYVILLIFLNITLFLNSQNVLKINIEEGLNELETSIKCSYFINRIEYIPLENKQDFMIHSNPKVSVVDQLVIIRTLSNCLVFDKNSGEFIRKIGNRGRGPNEFRSAQGFINPVKETIYFIGWHSNLLEFGFDGGFLRSIKIPEYKDDFESPSMPTHYTYWNNNIVCYFANIMGNEKKLLMTFNNNGEIIYVHKNSNIYPNMKFSLTTKESKFYHFEDNLFFKENYNDTVYNVTNKGLNPKIVLFTGKYRKPYESKWWTNKKMKHSEFITPYNLIETKSFIFFKFFFQGRLLYGIFKKENDRFKLTELGKGVDNDIDGFIPFLPVTISNDGDLVGIIDAYIILQWFKDNPEKAAELPPHLQKLKEIKEMDNPVVIIGKIKE